MPKQADRTGALVRATPRTPQGDERLAAMLRQDSRHYDGLSTAEAERLRGRILAAFEERTVTGAVLAAIREELRTSSSPVVLAGAARALRGGGAIDGEIRALLEAASDRIESRDEYIRFDEAGPDGGPPGPPLTARQEIAAAIAAPAQPCCAAAGADTAGEGTIAGSVPLCPGALAKVTVEDQAGASAPLVDLLRGRTSLIAAFYTRCMNPAKCSLTVTRLAAFARFAQGDPLGRAIEIVALSYDGAWDNPARLFAYGRDRGFPFGERARMIRCRSGWDSLRRQLGLRVGYGEATVNDHARELFLVRPGLDLVGLDAEWLADREKLMARIAEALEAD